MKFNTQLPAIIVLKKSDTLEPFTVYGGSFKKSEILRFISESTVPKMVSFCIPSVKPSPFPVSNNLIDIYIPLFQIKKVVV